jgi:hypothetical protein
MTAAELVKKLIAKGANVNARATKEVRNGYRHNDHKRVGGTPLLFAARNVDPELVRVLLANGADPQLKTDVGTTTLMVAAGLEITNPGEDTYSEDDALEVVKILVGAGIDVNAVNTKGETALHGAARRGAISITRFLVDRGARLDIKSTNGLLPINVADGLAPDGRTLFLNVGGMPETAKVMRELMLAQGMPVSPRPKMIVQRDGADAKPKTCVAPPGVVFSQYCSSGGRYGAGDKEEEEANPTASPDKPESEPKAR